MITVANYHFHYHDRLDPAALSPGERDAYNLMTDGILAYYGEDPVLTSVADIYLATLNRKEYLLLRDGSQLMVPRGYTCWACKGTGAPRKNEQTDRCSICGGNGWNYDRFE